MDGKNIQGRKNMYKIKWYNGQIDKAETMLKAHDIISREYPNVVYCFNGDSALFPYESELKDVGRILFWENEEDSNNDNGQHALGDIIEDGL